MMSTKFIEGFGGKLAEGWVARLLTPAFCFWMGGFCAWVQRFGFSTIKSQFNQLSEPIQLSTLTVALLVIALSAFIIQQLDLTILRFLEGYWPRWILPLVWLRRRLLNRQRQHLKNISERWQLLMVENDTQTPKDDDIAHEILEELSLLEYQRHWMPSQVEYLMPTAFGNILRAAERRPLGKYGLDAVICWPYLWLLLPDNARNDLQEARANLNTAARVWFWSILFACVWTPLAWWALLLGLGAACLSYYWLLSVARNYGRLVEISFDLYRTHLYTALRLSLPSTAKEEYELGKCLTEYLWRGPRLE